MDCRVESADRPDRTQPGDHERPPRRPGGQILDIGEDVGGAVEPVFRADGESNSRGEDQDQVHGHEDSLHLTHDAGHGRGDEGVAGDSGGEDTVDGAIAGRPVAVAGDDDDGEEHQGEAVCWSVSVSVSASVSVPFQRIRTVDGA